MQKKCPLVFARRGGQPVRVSDTVDPLSGRPRPLVLDAECLPVEESDDDDAIFTIVMVVIFIFPFIAFLYLACRMGWI